VFLQNAQAILLDCEQSLFYLKIRGEERKEKRNAQASGGMGCERASDMRSGDPQVVRRVFRRPRYLWLV